MCVINNEVRVVGLCNLNQMDMRKLIDDTDFDNLNQLSKRWKKEGSPGSMAESKATSSHTDRPCKHRASANIIYKFEKMCRSFSFSFCSYR